MPTTEGDGYSELDPATDVGARLRGARPKPLPWSGEAFLFPPTGGGTWLARQAHRHQCRTTSTARSRRSRFRIGRGRTGLSPMHPAGAAWTCETATRP